LHPASCQRGRTRRGTPARSCACSTRPCHGVAGSTAERVHEGRRPRCVYAPRRSVTMIPARASALPRFPWVRLLPVHIGRAHPTAPHKNGAALATAPKNRMPGEGSAPSSASQPSQLPGRFCFTNTAASRGTWRKSKEVGVRQDAAVLGNGIAQRIMMMPPNWPRRAMPGPFV